MSYRIADIIEDKKGISVVLEDEEALLLDADIYSDFYLYPGKELEEEEILSIKKKIALSEYCHYAESLLKKRPYSSHQIAEKLRYGKKLSPDRTEAVIERLKEKHLLDDRQYAEELLFALENKGYGYLRIVEEGKKAGVSFEDFNYDEERELRRAESLLPGLQKKFALSSAYKIKESILRSLIGYGYHESVAFKAVQSLPEDLISEDKEKLKRDYIRCTYRFSEEEKEMQKQKIIDKLRRNGYRYNDIIDVMEGENHE